MGVSGLGVVYNAVIVDMGDIDGQTATGRIFNQQIGYVKTTFRDINGATVNNVRCQIAFGGDDTDRIFMDYNGKIINQPAQDRMRLYWVNTPGVFIHLDISRDATLFQTDTPNPIQTLTSAVGTQIIASQTTVGTSAVQLFASNANDQSRMIQNISTTGQNLFIGDSGVTTATGWRLQANEAVCLDKSYAAIWGICASAGCPVSLLRETL